jgi:hypothetical protein
MALSQPSHKAALNRLAAVAGADTWRSPPLHHPPSLRFGAASRDEALQKRLPRHSCESSDGGRVRNFSFPSAKAPGSNGF